MGWTFYNSNGEALVQNAESEATQAEVEAESAVVSFVPPDLLRHAPGIAKCWIQIAGDGSATNGSYNVASIDDTGTGNWLITIADDFSSDDYSIQITHRGTGDSHVTVGGAPAAGSFRINSNDRSNALEDQSLVFAAAFGDQ